VNASGTGYYRRRRPSHRTELLTSQCGDAARRCGGTAVLRGWGDTWPAGSPCSSGAGDNGVGRAGVGAGLRRLCHVAGAPRASSARRRRRTARPGRHRSAGFAGRTGRQLPLVCTLNGAPGTRRCRAMLGSTSAGSPSWRYRPRRAEGLVWVRISRRAFAQPAPTRRGALQGTTTVNLTPANVARARSRVCCARWRTARQDRRPGGDVEPRAARRRRRALCGRGRSSHPPSSAGPVDVPTPGEYVARGAAVRRPGRLPRRAPPAWLWAVQNLHRRTDAEVVERYHEARAADPGTIDQVFLV